MTVTFREPRPLSRAPTVTAEVHPDYRHQQLVPEYALPQNISVSLAFLGLIAGAVLGVGIGDFAAGDHGAAVVRIVAEACARDPAACAELTMRNSVRWGWLAVGVLLAVTWAIASFRRRRKAANTDDTDPPGPTQRAVIRS